MLPLSSLTSHVMNYLCPLLPMIGSINVSHGSLSPMPAGFSLLFLPAVMATIQSCLPVCFVPLSFTVLVSLLSTRVFPVLCARDVFVDHAVCCIRDGDIIRRHNRL